jgi:regulator of nucleoside diphosphate kinase
MSNSSLYSERAQGAPAPRRTSRAFRAAAAANIYVTEVDRRRLVPLTDASSDASRGAAILQDKLDRALVLASGEGPLQVARLDSVVRYEASPSGAVRTVRLVLPDAADVDADRISVFAPVGAALFGLPVGAAFAWEADDGATRSVTVLEVGDDHGPA